MKKSIIFVGLVAVMSLCIGVRIPVTQAQVTTDTIESLRAQIAALTAQLKVLESGQGVQSGTKWCHTFNTNLKIGDQGSEVGGLLGALMNEGNTFSDYTTGENYSWKGASFEEEVASAVTKFQEKYRDEILTPSGLVHGTGFVGKATRQKLNQLYGCGTVVNPPVTSGNMPPVIDGVSGPTALAQNTTGTWKITAHDPERASLRYSVVWGDESGALAPDKILYENRTGSTNAQETTFTHVYAKNGIYTVAFYVTDNAGKEAKSTITVNVGNTVSKVGSLSIVPDSIALKVGETAKIKAYYQLPMPPCPTGYACAMMMPAPQQVDADFSPDTSGIIDFSYGVPECSMYSGNVSAYCGRVAMVRGLKAGAAQVKATYVRDGITYTAATKISVYEQFAGSVSVTRPNGGEKIVRGSSPTVTYKTSLASGKAIFYFLKKNGLVVGQLAQSGAIDGIVWKSTSVIKDDGSIVSPDIGDGYTIFVGVLKELWNESYSPSPDTFLSAYAAYDESDKPFSIVAAQ